MKVPCLKCRVPIARIRKGIFSNLKFEYSKKRLDFCVKEIAGEKRGIKIVLTLNKLIRRTLLDQIIVQVRLKIYSFSYLLVRNAEMQKRSKRNAITACFKSIIQLPIQLSSILSIKLAIRLELFKQKRSSSLILRHH